MASRLDSEADDKQNPGVCSKSNCTLDQEDDLPSNYSVEVGMENMMGTASPRGDNDPVDEHSST